MYLGSCQLDAAYLGSCKLDKIYLGVCEVLSGETAPAVPVFDALTSVDGLITGVKTGTGGATSARASSSWQSDYLGMFREFGNNEPAITGARVVRNKALYSEDYTNVAWAQSNVNLTQGVADPFGGNNAVRIEATAGNAFFRQDIALVEGDIPQTTYWVRRVSGSGTTRFYRGAGASLTIAPITSEWQRIAPELSEVTTVLLARVGAFIDTSGDVIELAFSQLELVNGQSNQNPGEYVKSVATTGISVFDYENGNTVASNVVTEAKGAPIGTDWWYVAEPESTNYFLHSFVPATQDVTRTGEHTVSVVGTGSVTLSGGLTGVVTDGTPITGDPAGVAVTCTVAGSLFSVNFEPGSVATSPIETTTGPATRPADALQFDIDNHDQNRGCYTLEMIPIIPTYGPIGLRAGSATSLLYTNDNIQLRTHDGINVVLTTTNIQIGVPVFCGITYDSDPGFMTNRVSTGPIGDDITYDGDFTIGGAYLIAGVLPDAPFRIRNIKRYDVPYAEGKAILEALT